MSVNFKFLSMLFGQKKTLSLVCRPACLTDVCGHVDADIVSLDLSGRLPFRIKNGPINLAVSRGMVFEIRYSPAIRDQNARRNLIANAAALAKVTKGRNIIISSDAQAVLELRAPADVINL